MSALEIFAGVPGIFADSIEKYAPAIKQLLTSALQNADKDVRLVGVKAYTAFVGAVKQSVGQYLGDLLPQLFTVRVWGQQRLWVAADGRNPT